MDVENESSLDSLVQQAKQLIKEISVQDTLDRLNNSSARVLDIREPTEYTKGTTPNAHHVPRGMLEAKVDRKYKGRDPSLQNRDQELLVICKTGGRSALAAVSLTQMGFTNVVSVAGGYDAWVKEGLPTQIPESCNF